MSDFCNERREAVSLFGAIYLFFAFYANLANSKFISYAREDCALVENMLKSAKEDVVLLKDTLLILRQTEYLQHWYAWFYNPTWRKYNFAHWFHRKLAFVKTFFSNCFMHFINCSEKLFKLDRFYQIINNIHTESLDCVLPVSGNDNNRRAMSQASDKFKAIQWRHFNAGKNQVDLVLI